MVDCLMSDVIRQSTIDGLRCKPRDNFSTFVRSLFLYLLLYNDRSRLVSCSLSLNAYLRGGWHDRVDNLYLTTYLLSILKKND